MLVGKSTLRKLSLGFILALALALVALIVPSDGYAAGEWKAQYWNNKDLSGSPVLERQEDKVDYDWGANSPAPGVNAAPFSARWQRTINVSGGTYRFTAQMDDGLRVWVDGSLIINEWRDGAVRKVQKDIFLNAGAHQLKVEYYNSVDKAVARLSWPRISDVPGGWRGEYFNNMSLSGAPALVRQDGSIDFDWGGGSPEWGVVGADNFSVRWTGNLNVSSGRYRFTMASDDGARLWVNGRLLLDKWLDQQGGYHTAEIDLGGGAVPVQMEYYENVGGAKVFMDYFRVGNASGVVNPPIYNWRGEYFNNTGLSGAPALVRDDGQINFNWGYGSPAPGTIGSDYFSVRWTRTIDFTPGRYRFIATSDDGVRVWVNNRLVIDNWRDHAAQTVTGEIDLAGGAVPVRVEYYDGTMLAEVRLDWTRIGGAGNTGGAVTPGAKTAVVTSYRLNVRQGPSVQHAIIGKLDRGAVVPLAGYRNADASWVMIILPDGRQGWSYAGLLQSSYPFTELAVWSGQTGTPPSSAASGTVTAYRLNVRQGPGVSFSVLTAISRGATVQLLGRNAAATWVKVSLASGAQGWVNASYLSTTTPVSNLPISG